MHKKGEKSARERKKEKKKNHYIYTMRHVRKVVEMQAKLKPPSKKPGLLNNHKVVV